MVAWFLSDLHLDLRGQNWAPFFRFAQQCYQAGDQVFFLGDIFDLWVGNHAVWLEIYRPIVKVVENLAQSGRVYYLEGNHDLAIEKFWQTRKVTVHKKPQLVRLGDCSVWIDHGDYFNPQERMFHLWLNVAKSKAFESVINRLPAKWVYGIGKYWWQTRHEYKTKQRVTIRKEIVTQLFQEYCHQIIQKHKPDYVVLGHVHLKFDYIWYGVRCFNLGWWGNEVVVLKFDFSSKTWEWIQP